MINSKYAALIWKLRERESSFPKRQTVLWLYLVIINFFWSPSYDVYLPGPYGDTKTESNFSNTKFFCSLIWQIFSEHQWLKNKYGSSSPGDYFVMEETEDEIIS